MVNILFTLCVAIELPHSFLIDFRVALSLPFFVVSVLVFLVFGFGLFYSAYCLGVAESFVLGVVLVFVATISHKMGTGENAIIEKHSDNQYISPINANNFPSSTPFFILHSSFPFIFSEGEFFEF